MGFVPAVLQRLRLDARMTMSVNLRSRALPAAFLRALTRCHSIVALVPLRLDGQDDVGNSEVAGRFFLAGRQWKVHSDTHFEPLLVAYRRTHWRGGGSPFGEVSSAA